MSRHGEHDPWCPSGSQPQLLPLGFLSSRRGHASAQPCPQDPVDQDRGVMGHRARIKGPIYRLLGTGLCHRNTMGWTSL